MGIFQAIGIFYQVPLRLDKPDLIRADTFNYFSGTVIRITVANSNNKLVDYGKDRFNGSLYRVVKFCRIFYEREPAYSHLVSVGSLQLYANFLKVKGQMLPSPDAGELRNFNMAQQRLAHITLVVDDYDRALKFYTEILGFNLVEDTVQTETKRWVLIQPPGSTGCCLLLAKAVTDEQKSRIGNQTGGRVFLFLHTDNFKRDYQELVMKGVRIIREPSVEKYGTVSVFADLYGNLIDLVEPH